ASVRAFRRALCRDVHRSRGGWRVHDSPVGQLRRSAVCNHQSFCEDVKIMSNDVTKPIPAAKPPVKFVERPWGSYKQFAHNQPVTVSLMTVLPGQRLSLQSHTGRAELWIVLDDGAVVQVGEETRTYNAGDEIWINANEKHRL